MKTDIRNTLSRLDLTIGRAANCHFNNPVAPGEIESFEKRNGIRLPNSYKLFLEYTNGGMIVNDSLEEIIKRDKDLETAKWNANCLLSLEEIEDAYNTMINRTYDAVSRFGEHYPFIPFCKTSTNEYLVFVNLSKGEKESAVFDAFHEEQADTWGQLTENFNEFLINYIDNHGDPEVLGDEAKGLASDLLEPKISNKETKETNQEIILRTTERIKVDPDDHWAFMERGIAYKDTAELKAALKDFNRSIELKDDDPFYYFKRGDLFQTIQKRRAALIDYDIAVKLQPEDTLYLSCRAGILWEMKKYEASLKDVNKAIEIDGTDILAYMIRESIYISLGETAEADKDRQKIEELQNDG